MLRVSDIMTRDVVTLTPETSLRDAVELFATRHISGAPVVNGHELVGVLSAGDIIGFMASTSGDETEPDVEEWSEWSDPGTGDEPESENVAPGSYFTNLFCDGSTDVVDRMNEHAATARSLLDERDVDEVMTRGPITLSPNDSVLHAAALMKDRGIHRVLVVDEGKVVGIVSALDVARAVAQHKLATMTYVVGVSRLPF